LKRFAVALIATSFIFAAACSSDEEGDQADVGFSSAPSATMTADSDVAVSWTVTTDGELHHSELRACIGHVDPCGLGDASSFDENFSATNTDGTFEAMLNLSAGAWTVAAFAHVGETPFISDVVHVTVQ
jgi:hypothetical protein